MPNRSHQSGFTLIELSIVLVIIGLLVGSILVGQDLITAATIRSQLSQIDKYNAAVNAFKAKYSGLPGDLIPSAAAQFGLTTRAGSTGRGDGNGLIEGAGTGSTYGAGEIPMFWNDLSTVGLIEGGYGGTDCDYVSGACATYPDHRPLVFPPAKIGEGNFIVEYADSGYNYYQIIRISPEYTYATTSGGWYVGTVLLPREAYAIDSKIDDGQATTGVVVVRGTDFGSHPPGLYGPWWVGWNTAGPASGGFCVSTDTTPVSYNLSSAPRVNNCTISIRAGF